MAQPIQPNLPIPQAAHCFVLRRQLTAELAELIDVLRKYPMVDRTSVRLDDWHRQFTENLRAFPDEETTLNQAIEQLHDFLKDGVQGSPHEEVSYLGNDGQVYGHKALVFYLDHMSREHRGRSPFNPNQETLFVVWPHPIVNAVVRWLERRGRALPPLPEIAHHYAEMEQLGTIPEIPTESRVRFQERVRQLAARRAERDQANTARGEAARAAAQLRAAERVDEAFNGVRDQLEENARHQRERVEDERRRDAAARANLQEREREWAGRVSRLTNRNDAVDERLGSVQEGTNVAEQDTKQLAASIAETTKAINDRDAQRDANGWKGIAIGVACAAAAYATGMSVTHVPGGATVGTVIPI